MVFKDFNLKLVLRIIFIFANTWFFFYIIYDTNLYLFAGALGIICILQFYSLYKFVKRTNIILERFFDSIQYSDFTQSYATGLKGAAFERLNRAFDRVMERFRQTRNEKEEHSHYLNTIVQHINVGLIAYTPTGEVQLLNKAAKHMLKINSLKEIESLRGISPELADKITKITPGRKEQLKVQRGNQTLFLSLSAAKFVLNQQHYTLVSLQNIRWELEEKEMEAWSTLIRTLTHEIMNSIAPISSLSSTVKSLIIESIEEGKVNGEEENISDALNAVATIENRSRGLIDFVENYRKLYKIPQPNLEIVAVRQIFNRVLNLMKEEFADSGIKTKASVDPNSLEITADPTLIESVLINLLKNSHQALKGRVGGGIELRSGLDGIGSPFIAVIDNGPGIQPGVLEQVFIPFFTTKENGSGIGLSLSKQVMRLHNGTIEAFSEPEVKTSFILRFNQ